ncbi:MAG: hypothetical protein J6T33_02630 [Bacteroidales bacterium]|jgi:hypothetical protein|nr:hypothetical protein [Bacteroidales bacterium]MBP5241253.1 hypothetical protein [Bacteroidales bacterium]
MKRLFALVAVVLISAAVFSSCKKEDKDYAAKIAGTYLGTNDFKIETQAKVVITRSDDEYVSVQYDASIEEEKELAPVGFKVRVKKSGDNYTLSGSSTIESIDGTVTGSTLKMKVYQGEVEIINFVGTKQ